MLNFKLWQFIVLNKCCNRDAVRDNWRKSGPDGWAGEKWATSLLVWLVLVLYHCQDLSNDASLKVKKKVLYVYLCYFAIFVQRFNAYVFNEGILILKADYENNNPSSANSHYTSIEHQAVQTRELVSVAELGNFLNIFRNLLSFLFISSFFLNQFLIS